MAKRTTLALAARPVDGPMSISALYCKAGGVRAASSLVQRETMQSSAASRPYKTRVRLRLVCLVAYYA
jgi:hypothetical protein